MPIIPPTPCAFSSYSRSTVIGTAAGPCFHVSAPSVKFVTLIYLRPIDRETISLTA